MKKEIAGHFLCSNWISTKLTELEIVEILNLQNPTECTFDEGLLKVHTNDRSKNPNSILISPLINSYRLIIGCQLLYTTLSKDFTEKLSKVEGISFSLGVDIWCGYYFWMFSEKGKLKRYYLFSDGEIEEDGNKTEIDNFLKDCKDQECVFKLSEEFGLDMDLISINDLYKKATVWEFNNTPGWLKDT